MARKPVTKKSRSAKAKTLAKRATPAGVSDRNHLIGVIQAGTGSSKRAAKDTLDALLDTVTLSLKRNKKVRLTGFGSFIVARWRAHKGRNPATGEAIRIKASKRVRFKAGTKLKGGI